METLPVIAGSVPKGRYCCILTGTQASDSVVELKQRLFDTLVFAYIDGLCLL